VEGGDHVSLHRNHEALVVAMTRAASRLEEASREVARARAQADRSYNGESESEYETDHAVEQRSWNAAVDAARGALEAATQCLMAMTDGAVDCSQYASFKDRP
jgi:hypothetical protein